MDTFLPLLTIFLLAVFVGWEIITKVPPLLHTPLMSGSNAISGITIIGAILSVAVEGRLGDCLDPRPMLGEDVLGVALPQFSRPSQGAVHVRFDLAGETPPAAG